jgi:hypothetical protein
VPSRWEWYPGSRPPAPVDRHQPRLRMVPIPVELRMRLGASGTTADRSVVPHLPVACLELLAVPPQSHDGGCTLADAHSRDHQVVDLAEAAQRPRVGLARRQSDGSGRSPVQRELDRFKSRRPAVSYVRNSHTDISTVISTMPGLHPQNVNSQATTEADCAAAQTVGMRFSEAMRQAPWDVRGMESGAHGRGVTVPPSDLHVRGRAARI